MADGGGMTMEIPELRRLALEALRQRPNDQFGDVLAYVETHSKPRGQLTDSQRVQLAEVIWELMLSGVLAPCHPGYRLNIPPMHVTEYGRECLAAGEITPHDPDGFLASLSKEAQGQVDDVVRTYVEESLRCFGNREFLAATVLIGVASERSIDMVAEAYLDGSPDDTERERRKRKLSQTSRSVKRRFDLLRGAANSCTDLPESLRESLDIHFGSIFEIIRRTRNDAGHPRGAQPGRHEAHACILLFPSYYWTICELCAYLRGAVT
jgi:hypothetical protein